MTKSKKQEFIDACVKYAEKNGALPYALPHIVERAASAYDFITKHKFKVTKKTKSLSLIEISNDCVEIEVKRCEGKTDLDRFHYYDVKVDAKHAFKFADKYNYILVKK